jgi:hypothetical protein
MVYNFVKFMDRKKVRRQIFPPLLLLLLLDPGFGMEKNLDPG